MPAVRPASLPGMLYTIQCTKSFASGSSASTTSSCVFSGTSCQRIVGDRPPPSQPFSAGGGRPGANAPPVIWIAGRPLGWGAGDALGLLLPLHAAPSANKAIMTAARSQLPATNFSPLDERPLCLDVFLHQFARNCVRLRDLLEHVRARLGDAVQRPLFAFKQSKLLAIALRPFEVVLLAPVQVAAHVHAVFDRARNLVEMSDDVALPLLVVVGADAVLRDVDGDAVMLEAAHALVEPLR